MDEFCGKLDCRLGVSLIDSFMMWILHSAMDKSHDNLKAKEGVIERLTERSKFCELAIIQLEGCLKFVQEEEDTYILENSYDKLLPDLRELRDRLQGRLRETELAISEKDGELVERLENELKLRQALELREKELVLLRSKLEQERTKREGVNEVNKGIQGTVEEAIDGSFCELKNSVQQQMWNIKQKLEDERINLNCAKRKINKSPTSSINLEACIEPLEEEVNRSMDDKLKISDGSEASDFPLRPDTTSAVEQMGSDMETLKETLDIAFGTMQSAISISEVSPIEGRWRWKIEKDIISISMKGFIKDLRENIQAEMREGKSQFPTENWLKLMNEITVLRSELESLCRRNDIKVKGVSDVLTSSTGIHTGYEIYQRTKGRSLSEGDSYCFDGNVLDKDIEQEGSHFVAKMIKNHETIIRRKSEEMNWVKGEYFRDKGFLATKRDRDLCEPKDWIQKVIAKLDTFVERNTGVGVTLARSSESHETHKESKKFNTTDGQKVAEGNLGSFYCRIDVKLHDELRKFQKVREESDLRTLIMDETYSAFLKGLIEDIHFQLYDYEIESIIWMDICWVLYRELVDTCKMDIEDHKMGSLIKEDISQFVIVEVLKDACFFLQKTECQHQIYFSEISHTFKTLSRNSEIGETENLFQKLDSLLQFFEFSDKEQNPHLNCEELDERIEFEMLLVEEITFGSVSTKLEKCLEQLGRSKALLTELGYSLAASATEENVNIQMIPTEGITHERENSICIPRNNDDVQLNPADSVFSCLVKFSEVYLNFGLTMQEKLGKSILRYYIVS